MAKKQQTDDATLPEFLGSAYAHFQHGVDKVTAWGLKKMREAGDGQTTATPRGKVERIGRGLLGFFGKAGDAYYKTYEELKQKKQA